MSIILNDDETRQHFGAMPFGRMPAGNAHAATVESVRNRLAIAPLLDPNYVAPGSQQPPAQPAAAPVINISTPDGGGGAGGIAPPAPAPPAPEPEKKEKKPDNKIMIVIAVAVILMFLMMHKK